MPNSNGCRWMWHPTGESGRATGGASPDLLSAHDARLVVVNVELDPNQPTAGALAPTGAVPPAMANAGVHRAAFSLSEEGLSVLGLDTLGRKEAGFLGVGPRRMPPQCLS